MKERSLLRGEEGAFARGGRAVVLSSVRSRDHSRRLCRGAVEYWSVEATW
jgi:hypothetical protein